MCTAARDCAVQAEVSVVYTVYAQAEMVRSLPLVSLGHANGGFNLREILRGMTNRGDVD
jgi:hypothetical protein